ncbi:MAG: diaminopimelate epimerase [Pseudomonadales bacterium]|jgi:diaminopimelate epimerase|nr:diaminopimelate epimerase [Pseudomonadales bacterium]MCP5332099.1 diaminopimelate epimerase [Pseudomonadales bacterium]HMW14220.1 diaminopimelate epimerase [Pseudomonadales bacterium]HMW82923.1 diaminopimelate epimerase [Pseudomonadales bacterium]HMZ70192.1 diaminopimelate epimerase [Pseudomonadales bacterium]
MRLRFTKMQGAGNDFMVVDLVTQQAVLTPTQIRQLADRHFGVGFDQLLLVEPPTDPGIDFKYRIFNADGGEVEQCGNGARCFARFVRDQRLSWKERITVETRGGLLELLLERDGSVTVDMGAPDFSPKALPFQAEAEALHYPLEVAGQTLEIGAVSMGNPHAVLVVDDVERAPVTTLGPAIGSHPRFPKGVNVGFMQIVDRTTIKLRVHERGAGETLACGTGACAAAVIGMRRGQLDGQVTVRLTGGELLIRWAGNGAHVWMSGPATRVYEGWIQL